MSSKPQTRRRLEPQPPTRRELLEHIRIAEGQLYQAIHERDHWGLGVKALEMKIAEANERIAKVLRARDEAPGKVSVLVEKIRKLKESIESLERQTKAGKIGRRAVEALALTALGSRDKRVQSRGQEIIGRLNAGVGLEEIWEEFRDLQETQEC